MIEKVEAYRALDGKLFDNPKAAEAYEGSLRAGKRLHDLLTILPQGTSYSAKEIVECIGRVEVARVAMRAYLMEMEPCHN